MSQISQSLKPWTKKAIIVVGQTGCGKSQTINMLCGVEGPVSGCDSALAGTKQSALYHDPHNESVVYIDSVGTGDPDEKTDAQVLQEITQTIFKMIFDEQIGCVAVVWCVPPSVRGAQHLKKEAAFIESLMTGNPDPNQNIWDSTIIIVKKSSPMSLTADVQGALYCAAQNGARASENLSGDGLPLGDVHGVFGYTCLDWMPDGGARQRNYPEEIRRDLGLLLEEEVKEEIMDALGHAEGIKMFFTSKKCLKCSARGDPRVMSLACHTESRMMHPKDRTHAKEALSKHDWGEFEHKQAYEWYHTGSLQESRVHTGGVYQKDKYFGNTAKRCRNCRQKLFTQGCHVQHVFWSCCGQTGSNARGCHGRFPCCQSESESSQGCLRQCRSCSVIQTLSEFNSVGDDEKNGCLFFWSCCQGVLGSVGCVYACCEINDEIGCKEICKACDRRWGFSHGCDESSSHELVDCDADEISPELDEPLFTPFSSRMRIRRIQQALALIEAPLRTDVARTVVVFDESSALFNAYKHRRPEIEALLAELRIMFEEEAHRCQISDEYFSCIVRFEEESDCYRQFCLAKERYGSLHESEMIRGKETWGVSVDAINDFNTEVRARLGNEKLQQPMRNLVDMYIFAVVTQNLLREVIGDLSLTLNVPAGRFYECGQKSLYRIFEKIAFHCTRQWDPNVWDICRAMVSFDSITEIVDAMRMLDGDDRVEIVNVYNRFARDERKNDWQDLMLHVRFRGRPVTILAEIQFCLQTLTVARRDLGGHHEYSAFRSAMEVRRFAQKQKGQ